MGIDAQRSGASELPDRAVEVRRAQGATTKAIPAWIVEEEQRSDRRKTHAPSGLRRRARNATLCTFTTDSYDARSHASLAAPSAVNSRVRAVTREMRSESTS